MRARTPRATRSRERRLGAVGAAAAKPARAAEHGRRTRRLEVEALLFARKVVIERNTEVMKGVEGGGVRAVSVADSGGAIGARR